MIRHILYISDEAIRLFEWDNHQLIVHVEFSREGQNLEKFKEVVKNLSDNPVQILISLQEEDYQRETIPHASKKNQAFMAGRLLKKYYRDGHYKHFEIQGRNENGRKDNRLLLTSVSIEESLKQYIDVFVELKYSVAGIWSAPLFGRKILGYGIQENENYMLISKENNYYRESVFIKNELIISRKISHNRKLNEYQKAEFISSSVDHLYKFSTNKRLISFQDKMDVVCLIDENVYSILSDIKADSNLKFIYAEKNNLFDKMVVSCDKDITMDVLYSYLCSRQNINNPHYSSSKEVEVYYKKRLNSLVFRITGFLCFLLIFVSSAMSINNYYLSGNANKIKQEKNNFNINYNNRYGDIQNKIDNVDSTHYFLEDLLSRKAKASSIPTDLFYGIGKILNQKRFEKISIDLFDWKLYVGTEYDAISGLFPIKEETMDIVGDDLGLDVVEEEEKSKVYVHISGEFDHQDLDYSGAIDTMVFLNNALKNISYVEDVYMISAPVDVRTHSQFIDFSGSILNININKSNEFEFVLSIKEISVVSSDE